MRKSTTLAAGWVLLMAAAFVPAHAHAQSVLLRVSDAATGQPLQGTLVVLSDPGGAHAGSALTDPRGQFLFAGVAPGPYTVRGELIGYATRSESVTVTAGETTVVDLMLDSRAIELEGISVEGEGRCTLRPEAGLRVAEVWDEVRKALEAARWTNEQGVYEYRTRRYVRDVDGETGWVSNQVSRRGRVYLNSPFESRPAEDLLENGFVQEPTDGGEGEIYFAPDASVLLSDLFLDTHCMRLRSGDADQAGLVGLSFEPIRGRRIPDISGTLWIDPASWRLSHLEYSYENLSIDADLRGIGGQLVFQLLPNGTWIVPEWRIRMPLLAMGRDGRGRQTVYQRGYREEGAAVLTIREPGGDVLFSAGTAALEGLVLDGVTSEPVPGAVVSLEGTEEVATTDAEGRFRFTEVVPGRYQLAVEGAAAQGQGAASDPLGVELVPGQMASVTVTRASPFALQEASCAEQVDPRPHGSAMLLGRITAAESGRGLEGARVTIRWDDFASVAFLGHVSEEGVIATTGSDGHYRACVVPQDALLRITAEWQGHVTREDTIKVPQGEPGLVHDVRISVPPSPSGAASGGEAYSSARDPSHSMRLWVPSQNGLRVDWPQRHKKKGLPSRVSMRLPS